VRKILKPIFSKKFPGIVFLLVQLVFFLLPIFGVYERSVYPAVIISLFSVAVICYEINREADSGFKLIWIAMIAVFPVFGIFLYVYVHGDIISRNIRKKLGILAKKESLLSAVGTDYALLKQNAGTEYGIFKYLLSTANAPCFECSDVRYFSIGEDMFKTLLEDIKKADKYIFMEFFIINESDTMWQQILSVLKEKTAQKVEVRIIYDALGSYTGVGSDFEKRMSDYGIKCCAFAPLKPFLSTYHNNRDHRKMVIIDGKYAYTGGINIADEYINLKVRFGHWKDTAIRTDGQSVNGFLASYLRMWEFVSGQKDEYCKYLCKGNASNTGGYIVPFDDSPADSDYVTRNIYLAILNSAKEYVYINTPYLIPDEALLEAMKFACARGVRVCICMPHIPDKKSVFALGRSYYPELIRAGVEIYEYRSGFLHAKSTVSDDIRAYIGSANYDFRSLYLHYECGGYIYNNKVISDMKSDYESTISKCIGFTLGDYHSLSLAYRVFGRIMRLFASLM